MHSRKIANCGLNRNQNPRTNTYRRFLACESGATSIEYGLICGLIFLAIVASFRQVADNTTALHIKIQDATQ